LLKRISITGPESTGKSKLAKQLAKHFNTVWVEEYAREYLNSIGRPYNYADILKIAKKQLSNELELMPQANDYIFCDTDLVVTKIWCDVKFGKCHEWIEENILEHKHNLYLLCDVDLPWTEDPLREHPDKRKYLFDLYLKELKQKKLPYEIVNEFGNDRLQNAIKIILNTLK